MGNIKVAKIVFTIIFYNVILHADKEKKGMKVMALTKPDKKLL